MSEIIKQNIVNSLTNIRCSTNQIHNLEASIYKRLIESYILTNEPEYVFRLYEFLRPRVVEMPKLISGFIEILMKIYKRFLFLRFVQQTTPQDMVAVHGFSNKELHEELSEKQASLNIHAPLLFGICGHIMKECGMPDQNLEFPDLNDIDKPNTDMPDKSTSLPDNNPI